jgi:Alginate export
VPHNLRKRLHVSVEWHASGTACGAGGTEHFSVGRPCRYSVDMCISHGQLVLRQSFVPSWHQTALLLILGLSAAPTLAAQSATPVAPVAPRTTRSWTASVRTRTESWRWFDSTARGAYSYTALVPRVGIQQDGPRWHWKLDVSTPIALGLPDNATLPAPQGQLGLGGSYAAASNRTGNPRTNVAGIFVRQATAEWRSPSLAVRAGRMDVSDGMERTPANSSLAALKAARIGQRLIGSFGFTHGQRAFDGALIQGKAGLSTLTALAVRPTSGVFTITRAGQPLDVAVVYGAWSRGLVRPTAEVDIRLFNLWYRDSRSVVPVDTRPAATRSAASRGITVNTVGGHAIGTRVRGAWRFDALAWGALQSGQWSTLSQRAHALAVEAGVQRPTLTWSPWLRAGWYRGSGDERTTDQVNGTFFQVIPTPRIYARFPFFNGMNSNERFLTLQLKPRASMNARIGWHALQRTQSADLWWSGGGAFDDRAFGFVGRPVPAGTSRSLGSLLDASLEWKPTRRLGAELYAARASGGGTLTAVYGRQRPATLAYLEFTVAK